MTQDRCFDVIIIGSGIGGLTAASLLAQLAHKRVLVLERHFKIGGLTHSFSRHGFTWDVGLHYVGQMSPGTLFRTLFDFITRSGVQWQKMSSPFESFVYPDCRFAVSHHRKQFQQDLITQFPSESPAIRRYFHDINRSNSWYTQYTLSKLLPAPLAYLISAPQRSLAVQTTQEYLDRHFTNPHLKALLVSQWPDYGLPPARSAFAIHAGIVGHYLDGGYHPHGGAGKIAECMTPIIEAAGGACYVNHEVTQVLLDRGKATGVRVNIHRGGTKTEQDFFAPLVISDAGAYTTYAHLLPSSLHLPEQRAVAGVPQPSSAATIYLGLKANPSTLGFTGANHWLYTDTDHNAMYHRRNQLLEGDPSFAFLSFRSHKSPEAETHTAQVMSFADHASFAAWHSQPWKRRGDTYESLKHTIGEGLLDLVERYYPGFRQLVAYQEVSTPLSVETFTGQSSGAVYGIPATPERFRHGWFDIHTPIQGLLLTGSDVLSPGISGAMIGGVLTAAYLLGLAGFPRIVGAAQRYAQSTQHSSSECVAAPNTAIR